MEFLEQLEKIRTPWLTYIMRIFTELGAEMANIAILCAIYWCYNKKLAYRLVFGLFISGLMVQGLKITFRIPRPWVRDPNLNPIAEVIKSATGYSFPSGHTQSTTAMYGALALTVKRRSAKIACIAMICCVGFSRMYLGMHTPQDVITSFVLTSIVVLLVYKISKITFTDRNRGIIAMIVASASVVLLLYSSVLNYRGIIADEFAKDSCQAAFAGIGVAIGWYVENKYIHFNVALKDTRMQVIKYIVGIGITISFKLFTKAVLPDEAFVDGVINLVLVLWILVGYPMIFQRVTRKKEKQIEHL